MALARLALEVIYEGDANHAGSQVDVTLVQAQAVVALDVADVVSDEGEGAELAIGGLPEAATGTLTVSAGEQVLCELALPTTVCQLPVDQTPGVHNLVVAYSGDQNHAATTASVQWTVTAAPVVEPEPEPTPTPKPSPTPTPSPSPTAGPTPTATAMPTARPRPGLPSTGE